MTRGTLREKTSGYATWGVRMRPQDTVKKSFGGLGFDTNGQPFLSNQAGTIVFQTPTISSPSGSAVYGLMVIKMPIAGTSSSSGVFASMANPFGYDVIITSAVLDITTQSSGSSTVDIGIGADATTSNDGLIDGLSGAAAGIFNNEDNAGTNGKSAIRWTTSTFLNVAEASGDVDALVGNLYVTCYRR